MATDPATQQAYEERPLPLAAAIDLDREMARYRVASERWQRAVNEAAKALGVPAAAGATLAIDDAGRPLAFRWPALDAPVASSGAAAVAEEVRP